MEDRVRRIFGELEEEVDVIVISNATEPYLDKTFFYITGLTSGVFEGSSLLLYPDGRVEMITSRLEEESAKKAGIPLKVAASRDEAREAIGEAVGGFRRIGVNASELVHANAERLRRAAPEAELVDVSEAVRRARLVKDSDEIERIREAARIVSHALEEVIERLEPGMTEFAVAAELSYAMQKRGATGPSFETIVASGPNGAEPHYTVGDRKIQGGDLVVMDVGALCRRYVSDCTRTIAVGPSDAKQREMYDLVYRAQEAAFDAIRPGATGKEVDAAARDLIEATEYRGLFVHGLGHSIGLAVHDGGAMNPHTDVTLEEGMVFTVEPGVYVPGYGGVRIEDDIVVTADGHEVLTTATRDLLEV
jgi:Xaa-Pro dipeptidase